MDTAINAHFRMSLNEFLVAERYHYRLWLNTVKVRYLHGAFGILLLAGAAYLYWDYGETDTPYYMIGGGLWWFIWCFLLWRLSHRRASRRRYQKLPETHRELDQYWTFAPDDIHVRSSLGESDFTWTSFGKIVVTPNGIMCFIFGADFFHWIPNHAFASAADVTQVVAWAKAKVPVFTSMR